MRSRFPEQRVHRANQAPIRADRSCVVYWMIAARRIRFNFGLQRAAEWASRLGRPLVILEALRVDYPWASDRLHRFVLDGMADTLCRLKGRPVTYHADVERTPGASRGLLEAWGRLAAVVVTDEMPAFFLPRMIAAAARRLDVRLEAVDGNGLLPMAAIEGPQGTAVAFRRRWQRQIVSHLEQMPLPDPLEDLALPEPLPIPAGLAARWPALDADELEPQAGLLTCLPIDHSVGVSPTKGGAAAAEAALARFLGHRLARYAEARNRPDENAVSGLSPYLHFGHISAHEIFAETMRHVGWSPPDVAGSARGQREGWWGAGAAAEAFLDQLVTWRELAFHTCFHVEAPERYETLPGWARDTLARHAGDTRPRMYDLERFAAADTHDPLWNAAQRQLTSEGRIHGYLRMLWGKKIPEWSSEPREALEIMLELNDRYALDGRDPCSIAGITWVLGRYDRGWPERPIYGKIRSMSSEATARKVPVRRYLERYGPAVAAG